MAGLRILLERLGDPLGASVVRRLPLAHTDGHGPETSQPKGRDRAGPSRPVFEPVSRGKS